MKNLNENNRRDIEIFELKIEIEKVFIKRKNNYEKSISIIQFQKRYPNIKMINDNSAVENAFRCLIFENKLITEQNGKLVKYKMK